MNIELEKLFQKITEEEPESNNQKYVCVQEKEYQAIAYDSNYPWKHFKNIEDMFIFVLRRCLCLNIEED